MNLFLAFLLVCLSFCATAQTVTIHGTVRDSEGNTEFLRLMVVNKRSGQGKFAEPGGKFTISALKADTILIGAQGYRTYKLSMADSVPKDKYDVEIVLEKLKIELRQVEIFAERELEEINEDIEELGYREEDYMLSKGNIYPSPITFLYEKFSRREQQKRLAYELMNEAELRELLKELLAKYVDYDIIDLSQSEFDEFIYFLDVSDEQLQSTSDYDFIMFVKEKFHEYETRDDYYYMR